MLTLDKHFKRAGSNLTYLPEVQTKQPMGFRPSRPRSHIVEPIVLSNGRLKQDLHIGNDGPLREHNIHPIIRLQDIRRIRPLCALRTDDAGD